MVAWVNDQAVLARSLRVGRDDRSLGRGDTFDVTF